MSKVLYAAEWSELLTLYQAIATRRGTTVTQVVEKAFGIDGPTTEWFKKNVMSLAQS